MIGCILFDVYFMQKIMDMPYVKPIFFLPILLSVFIVFRPDELKKILNTGLHVKHLIIAVFAVTACIIIIIRSGNSSPGWLYPDQGLRRFLEDMLVIRPRTKEFLVGQPFMLLGFVLKNPWLLLIGMIGQVSIINTFMHAHSSLSISLIRTFNGLWLGFLIGVIVLEIYKAVKRRMSSKNTGRLIERYRVLRHMRSENEHTMG